MRIHIVVVLLAFLPFVLGSYGEGGEFIQNSTRAWGQSAFGLRSSISVEKQNILKGEPFIVSVKIENISGAKVDLQGIAAFDLSASSKGSRGSAPAFGSYWCPVHLGDKNPDGKTGLILGTPSRLELQKGASLDFVMDLTRHGWDQSISSYWPARVFDTVVIPGKYLLRLDIQVGAGTNPGWIRSNEVTIVYSAVAGRSSTAGSGRQSP